MKVQLTFKTPDIIDQVLYTLLDEHDSTEVTDEMEEDIREKLSKWVKFGEYIRVEIDTEADTATVLRP